MKPFSKVRHPNCLILCKGENNDQICIDCLMLNKKMKIYKKRREDFGSDQNRVTDSSHVNLRFLSKDELVRRLNKTQQKKSKL